MKVKVKSVNQMAVCDEDINIIIVKKPKRRYRTIIRTFYRYRYRRKNNED